jgi:hypothetical protein
VDLEFIRAPGSGIRDSKYEIRNTVQDIFNVSKTILKTTIDLESSVPVQTLSDDFRERGDEFWQRGEAAPASA